MADGYRLFNAGDFRAALAQYELALKAEPNSVPALTGLGAAKNALGDHRGAIAVYERALKLNPNLPNVGAWIGENYLDLGDRTKALEWFRWETTRAPQSVWATSFLGTVQSLAGQPDSARALFERAAQLDPNVGAQRYQNGAALARRGKHYRAVWEYSAALYLNSQLHQAYYALGASYAALGEKSRALQSYQTYLQHDTTSEWAARARQEIQRLSSAS